MADRKRLVENIFFYYVGFTVVSIFLIVSLFIASGNIDEGLKSEVETSFSSGVARIDDLGERMKMLNNVITQDSTFTTLVYQSDDSALNVAGLRSMNSLYRNLCFIARDVSYIFTLFSSSDIFLSSGDASFYFDEYYNRFMSIAVDGRRIEGADEVKDFIFQSFAQRRFYIRLDEFYTMTGSAFERYENAIMVLQSSSAYSSSPQYVSAYIIRMESLKDLLISGNFPQDTSFGITYISDGSTLVDIDYDPSQFYTSQRSSTATGFEITLAVPLSYIRQQSASVIWLLRLVITGGVVSGIMISLYYGIRRYRGIEGLLSALEGHSAPAKGSFADIGEKIISLRNEADEVERLNRTIQFESILTRGIQNSEDAAFITSLVSFAPSGYLVMVARMMEEGGLEARELFARLDENGFKGLLSVHSGSNDEIFVVPLASSTNEQLVAAIEAWFQEKGTAFMHIGLSPSSCEVEDLPDLYSKALSALYSLYMYENENALLCYEEEMRVMLLDEMGLDRLWQLRNMLLRSQEEEAIAWFEEVEEVASHYPLEAQERKGAFIHVLINVYEEVWTTLGIPGRPWLEWRRDMNLIQMKDAFIGLTRELCQYTASVKKSHNNELLDKLLDLISLGYKSPGFTAYGLSRQAGISEKYMQSFFREQMGVSFSQYLQILRLEKAKELLETTDWTNEKIAQETGFGSLNTFYRNFSKVYGITPKVFKEGLAKN